MTLSLGTVYRSFGGEMEASSTPMICRLLDSCRHQLSAIARFSVASHHPGQRFARRSIASGATSYTATPTKDDPNNKPLKTPQRSPAMRSVEFCNTIPSRTDMVSRVCQVSKVPTGDLVVRKKFIRM